MLLNWKNLYFASEHLNGKKHIKIYILNIFKIHVKYIAVHADTFQTLKCISEYVAILTKSILKWLYFKMYGEISHIEMHHRKINVRQCIYQTQKTRVGSLVVLDSK